LSFFPPPVRLQWIVPVERSGRQMPLSAGTGRFRPLSLAYRGGGVGMVEASGAGRLAAVPGRELDCGGVEFNPPTGGAGARVAPGRRVVSFANGEGAGWRRSGDAEDRAVGEPFVVGFGAALVAPRREAAVGRSNAVRSSSRMSLDLLTGSNSFMALA